VFGRGSHEVIDTFPEKPLDSNYAGNTVDICPVGALTSNDFRFKMRVWFLKETRSICTSCATGCNTVIGSRENLVYRQTPRQNDDVNETWMCDYGRLNFHYLYREDRLTVPRVRDGETQSAADWTEALGRAGSELKALKGAELAMIASGRMTNEELYLARELAGTLGIELIDIVPHLDAGDGLLLSADRNPNTAGARLLGLSVGEPGNQLVEIADRVAAGRIKGLIVLHEDALQCGISAFHLSKLSALLTVGLLPNATTRVATVSLPAAGFAEKRGSMINKNGRLQRLNRAVEPPGDTRDDWEILRDLIQNVGGSNGLYGIEDVFRQMARDVPALAGLSLSRIGDLGVQLSL
jgi:NADH-quinone oxidoreductase subunit G